MPKNIILLSDGTGNSSGKLFRTNVWRLYQALDLSEPGASSPGEGRQFAFYNDGVGTDSFKLFAWLGGAFGWGLKRNVRDLYKYLSRHYEDGDRVYCFGFSRGAFTVRVLTGLLAEEGLAQAKTESELDRLTREAFRRYRNKKYKRSIVTGLFRGLRNMILYLWRLATRSKQPRGLGTVRFPQIKFLGVWDTVAAYGLPFDELTKAWNCVFPLSFPDRNLSPIVDRARQALALDDERLSFHPELWNEVQTDQQGNDVIVDKQRLLQVWFAGMHSDVGGGYPDDGMSNVTLDWMMGQAAEAGLRFKKEESERIKGVADIYGKMHNSRQGLVAGLYRYFPRKLKDLCHDVRSKKNRVLIPSPIVHESVFQRIKRGIEGYAPIGLPEKYSVYRFDGRIMTLADGVGAPDASLENPVEANTRCEQQEKLWGLVWRKRLFYAFSTLTVFALAIFPIYERPRYAWEQWVKPFSRVIEWAKNFTPGFLSLWTNAFEHRPGVFLLLIILFLLLYFQGASLQKKIRDEMGASWRQSFGAGKKIDAPQSWLDRIFYSPRYQFSVQWINEKIFPGLIMIVGAAALVVILLRISFTAAGSLGRVCSPSATMSQASSFRFRSSDVCRASAYQVEENRRYRLIFTMEEEWRDDQLSSPLSGFYSDAPSELQRRLWLYAGVPLRRHLTHRWFKPIARIGERGNDEYPLELLKCADGVSFFADLTARRSGELFLYVNDVILPVSNQRQPFYRNNHGSALVRIDCTDECQPTPPMISRSPDARR